MRRSEEKRFHFNPSQANYFAQNAIAICYWSVKRLHFSLAHSMIVAQLTCCLPCNRKAVEIFLTSLLFWREETGELLRENSKPATKLSSCSLTLFAWASFVSRLKVRRKFHDRPKRDQATRKFFLHENLSLCKNLRLIRATWEIDLFEFE